MYPIASMFKSGLPTLLLQTRVTLLGWAYGSSDGRPTNNPLDVRICIRQLVIINVCTGVTGSTIYPLIQPHYDQPRNYHAYIVLYSLLSEVGRALSQGYTSPTPKSQALWLPFSPILFDQCWFLDSYHIRCWTSFTMFYLFLDRKWSENCLDSCSWHTLGWLV